MPRANQTVGLTHPDHGNYTVIRKDREYDAEDPLVKAYPWAFGAANRTVEQTTSAPGERRSRRKTTTKKDD